MLDEDLIQQLKPRAGVVPARWPYEPSACTRNCLQGRACDCTPDVADMDPPRPPMSRLDLLALAAVLVLSAACALGVVAHAAELW